MNDILIAFEIYFLGFIIAVVMAAMIKVMLIIIRRLSPQEKIAEKSEGESV
jgi:MFS superfamily sulfate permease-like transporter